MANKSPKLQKESVRMINSILATHAGARGNALPPAVTESAGATRFRVGFVGAGPVVQAIHLPALARLTDKFQVTHVMDPDTQVATAVASQVDAAVVPSVSALMEAVDVVVIASPTHLHVEQLVELSANPTLATLCEKPLAASREQLTTLAQLVATVNPLVVVGTMHEFDPGWRELRRHWGSTSADRIRSLICIPDNDRFVTRATQLVPPSRERAPRTLSDAELVRDAIVGLAVHSLPLVRSLLQRDYPLEIHEVSVIGSYGYAVLACIGTTTVEFVSAIHGGTAPVWTLEVASADAALHATFPPSYVYAGSVGGSVTTESGVITVAPCAVNGYVEEWRTLWSALTGRSDPDVVPATTLREVLADGAFVIALADAAYDFVVRRDQQATRAQR